MHLHNLISAPTAPHSGKFRKFISATRFLLTSCTILKNGQDARSTKDEFSCGTGILPVHKKVIENGARSQFLSTFVVTQEQNS
ncbi:MAG: hypothetical protein EAZ90_26695 [Oscillatoriales cyanobacterium]|nr:MAG: hypothetical protein EAZ94_27145 [Oscillatoriales cyanobacterium]TAE19185.1 MAG: hypothetical protein EAZ93_27490 [Oscillatoriales cyanobacterium]TAE37369.1 MAG: hypothetical protein EAZ90_26695 [Oscillatoriales cyanobacterium]TAE51258.1 MAG: hypothetical protein EAZ88_18575 [Oscillatoriales cyanobacterium]TAE62513.1 MAG: hypothetical protein EAZ86_30785 [Oscillatoriales cyanobacterium]